MITLSGAIPHRGKQIDNFPGHTRQYTKSTAAQRKFDQRLKKDQ